MSVNAQREEERGAVVSRREAHRPSLSVILVSQGKRADLERALAAVAGRCRRMEAQIIVVRASSSDDVAFLTDAYPKVTFVVAPAGGECSALRDLGMGVCTGDIVALRADAEAGDGTWLDAFCSMVGTIDDERPIEVEVSLATSVEPDLAPSDRRRGRTAPYATLTSHGTQKRRVDLGRVSSAIADVGATAPTLGSEM